MKNRIPVRRTTLRFRRWSRKAYAAFVSIGRCVTIGCLRKRVADSSLSKQKTTGTVGRQDNTTLTYLITRLEITEQRLFATQIIRPYVHTGEEEVYLLKQRNYTSTDYQHISSTFTRLLHVDNPCFFFYQRT